MGGYGSKIRKVSRYRSTVSVTFLATKQEFSFTKVSPIQSVTEIVLLGFLINTTPLNVYFILNYHLFFIKSYLFFVCEMGHTLNTCATGRMGGGHKKCVQGRTVGEGYHVLFVRRQLH